MNYLVKAIVALVFIPFVVVYDFFEISIYHPKSLTNTRTLIEWVIEKD